MNRLKQGRHRIRVVTFDLDDTLWDVRPAMLRAEQAQREWLLEYAPRFAQSLDADRFARVRAQVIAGDPHIVHSVTRLRRTVLAAGLRAAGYASSDAETLADGAFAAFLDARQAVTPYDGVDDLLAALARRFRLGTLSNGNASIRRLAIGRHFAFAISADEVGRSKPDPAIFAAARTLADVPAEAILHVGDNPDHDIDGARRAGFVTAWVRRPDVQATPTEVPDFTLSTVLELGDLLLGAD